MKGTCEMDKSNCGNGALRRFRLFLSSLSQRLRNGSFRCPVCREIVHGIGGLSSHLRHHCGW